jgi:malonate transporter MadM subunit
MNSLLEKAAGTAAGILVDNGLVTAFAVVGLVAWLSSFLADRLSGGRVHGSAVAIVCGLLLAYVGGVVTQGRKGIADVECLAGIGLLGGSMLRDLSIVATAYGVRLEELRKTGILGVVSLLTGIVSAFAAGTAVAFAFGYRDAVSLTTIAAGAATFIVGPVTGTALGAAGDVIALSVATGVVKAILVMLLTPVVARWIGLDNPRAALVYGGLMGTTSGVAAGLAATDEKLVPYGAMTATFYTGLGCLLGPSAVYGLLKAVCG